MKDSTLRRFTAQAPQSLCLDCRAPISPWVRRCRDCQREATARHARTLTD